MAIAFILSPTREPNGVRGYTNESTEASKSFKQDAFRPKIVDAAESIVLSRWPCLLSFDWAGRDSRLGFYYDYEDGGGRGFDAAASIKFLSSCFHTSARD